MLMSYSNWPPFVTACGLPSLMPLLIPSEYVLFSILTPRCTPISFYPRERN